MFSKVALGVDRRAGGQAEVEMADAQLKKIKQSHNDEGDGDDDQDDSETESDTESDTESECLQYLMVKELYALADKAHKARCQSRVSLEDISIKVNRSEK